jgi:hypothetical protein
MRCYVVTSSSWLGPTRRLAINFSRFFILCVFCQEHRVAVIANRLSRNFGLIIMASMVYRAKKHNSPRLIGWLRRRRAILLTVVAAAIAMDTVFFHMLPANPTILQLLGGLILAGSFVLVVFLVVRHRISSREIGRKIIL